MRLDCAHLRQDGRQSAARCDLGRLEVREGRLTVERTRCLRRDGRGTGRGGGGGGGGGGGLLAEVARLALAPRAVIALVLGFAPGSTDCNLRVVINRRVALRSHRQPTRRQQSPTRRVRAAARRRERAAGSHRRYRRGARGEEGEDDGLLAVAAAGAQRIDRLLEAVRERRRPHRGTPRPRALPLVPAQRVAGVGRRRHHVAIGRRAVRPPRPVRLAATTGVEHAVRGVGTESLNDAGRQGRRNMR